MRFETAGRRPIGLWLLPLLAMTLLIVVWPVQATIMQRLEIEELARKSTDVFYGQVLATQSYWNAERTRIYTAVTVRINETFKGTARAGEIVRIVQLGGEKDGSKTDYAGRPEFNAGESAVLFTTHNQRNELTIVGLKQGKMTVNGQTVTRDFSGIVLVERANSGKQFQPVKSYSTQLTLAELRRRIANAK